MSRRVWLDSCTDWWLWNSSLMDTTVLYSHLPMFMCFVYQCLVTFHLHVISFYIVCNCFWPSPLLYTLFFVCLFFWKINGFAQLGSFTEMNGIAWGSMRWQSEEHVRTNAWFNPALGANWIGCRVPAGRMHSGVLLVVAITRNRAERNGMELRSKVRNSQTAHAHERSGFWR